MTVLTHDLDAPLSTVMREGSQAEHTAAEGSSFMTELLAGRISEAGYAVYDVIVPLALDYQRNVLAPLDADLWLLPGSERWQAGEIPGLSGLLAARLEKHRHEAYHACCDLLTEAQIPAVLVDVEHLFDGQGLFFYFLGEVPQSTAPVMRLTIRSVPKR